jgi:hypothetical protein
MKTSARDQNLMNKLDASGRPQVHLPFVTSLANSCYKLNIQGRPQGSDVEIFIINFHTCPKYSQILKSLYTSHR